MNISHDKKMRCDNTRLHLYQMCVVMSIPHFFNNQIYQNNKDNLFAIATLTMPKGASRGGKEKINPKMGELTKVIRKRHQ